MPLLNPVENITEDESRNIASLQILSFLHPDTEGSFIEDMLAPSKRNFLLSSLPEGGPSSMSWNSRNLFDINGKLLFRDQTIELSAESELRVRTAASSFLKSPVWSVKAGLKINIDLLVLRTLESLESIGNGTLRPVYVEDEIRVICYSYPKLGIFCVTEDNNKFIVDIGDLSILPADAFEVQEHPDSPLSIWSPYDLVSTATASQFRLLWEQNVGALPFLAEAGEPLNTAVERARSSVIEERSVNPELMLVGQKTNVFCAVASGLMILKHHGITKTQDEIAIAMRTGSSGSSPSDQVSSISGLSNNLLSARLDTTPSFDEACEEIRNNRPFKSGITGHARACGGFKIEQGGKKYLYIFDPWPPNQGDVYYEDWSAVYYTNHMYVRPSRLT